MDDVIERLERIERLLKQQVAQPRYLDTRQVSELTGIAAVTLERWRVDGEGPPYVKLGRLVKYRTIDLHEFMERNLVSTINSPMSQYADY